MEKYRAIPEGYMRVGELAKSASVSVRTLQYYDKEGLLSPSASSDGGFRLYTGKDSVRLAQILMMKDLGFSLGEIKKRLASMDTLPDVVNVLTEHATEIRNQIAHLSESLSEIESLKEEIEQVGSVDFIKFSSILFALQIKNKHYRMIKHLDDDAFHKIGERMTKETAQAFSETMTLLYDEAFKLQKDKVMPESEEGQRLAHVFWGKMIELTGGDMKLLQKLNEIGSSNEITDKNVLAAQSFIESALEFYFKKQGEA